MRALKIIIKEEDHFETHLINLEKVYDIICTYPIEDDADTEIQKDPESVIANENGQKIEFKYEDNNSLEIDLEKTPAKFIIYDDYGNEINKTGDLEELESDILTCLSNEDPAFSSSSDQSPIGG